MEKRVIQILDAAQGRFARYGYRKTTMEEVAGDLGLVKSALYKYFLNKEALFQAVLRREMEVMMEAMKAAAKQHSDPADKLQAVLSARGRYMRQMRNIHQLGREVLLELRPFMVGKLSSYIKDEWDLIAELIRDGQQRGRFLNQPNAGELTSTVMLACMGLFFEAMELDVLKIAENGSTEPLLVRVLNQQDLLIRLLVTGLTAKKLSPSQAVAEKV